MEFPTWKERYREEGPRFRYNGPKAVIVYGLVDPRDQTLRYVGVTGNADKQLQAHLKAGHSSWEMRTWIRTAKRARAKIFMVTLGVAGPENWGHAERVWITWFRRRGRLYNVHAGGMLRAGERTYGSPGWNWNPVRRKPRAAGTIDSFGVYRPGGTPSRRKKNVARVEVAVNEIAEPEPEESRDWFDSVRREAREMKKARVDPVPKYDPGPTKAVLPVDPPEVEKSFWDWLARKE